MKIEDLNKTVFSEDTNIKTEEYTEIKNEINALMIIAAKQPDLDLKKEIYNEVYKKLHIFALNNQSSEQFYPELFTLFKAYAKDICYNQASPILDKDGKSVDPEEGFRKCDRLMGLSLLMQLEKLGLDKVEFNWTEAKDLESLIEGIGFEKGDNGKLFDQISQLNIDPEVILGEIFSNKEARNLLSQTLTFLTFSQQNISSFNNVKYKEFHQYYNKLTETMIGNDDPQHIQELDDYKYNRLGFLFSMSMIGQVIDLKAYQEAKIRTYEELKQNFIGRENYRDSSFLQGKVAQISNMQGLMILAMGSKSSKLVKIAINYFKESLETRERLLKQEPENPNHKFLIANVRTGLIECLLKRKPVPHYEQDTRLDEAQGHMKELVAYLNYLDDRKDNNSYRSSYENAIKSVEKALKERQEMIQ